MARCPRILPRQRPGRERRAAPEVTVQRGRDPFQVVINGKVHATPDDCCGLNRLIATLRRARDAMQPSDDIYCDALAVHGRVPGSRATH